MEKRPEVTSLTQETYNFRMQKTAQDLASHVMQKLAVSRWREAIYSGELNTPEAEKLKAHMGVNPNKYSDRLVEGVRNRLAARGNKIYYGFDPIQARKELPYAVASKVVGYSMNPLTGNVFNTPFKPKRTQAIPGIRDIPQDAKSLHKQVNNLFLSHEGMESDLAKGGLSKEEALRRRYTQWIPEEWLTDKAKAVRNGIGYIEGVRQGLLKPGTPNKTLQYAAGSQHLVHGSHMDPSVVLNELRQSRMMSPSVRDAFSTLRLVTGEGYDAYNLSPHSRDGGLLLRKKELPAIAQRMRDLANLRAQDNITALDAAMNKTFAPASKVRGIATNVLNKLKGFIR